MYTIDLFSINLVEGTASLSHIRCNLRTNAGTACLCPSLASLPFGAADVKLCSGDSAPDRRGAQSLCALRTEATSISSVTWAPPIVCAAIVPAPSSPPNTHIRPSDGWRDRRGCANVGRCERPVLGATFAAGRTGEWRRASPCAL
eukprot:scaffold158081_cov32-Tisochrysis_lutea.AAC.2